VVIQGESGTGKGVAARVLHAMSDRASGPFVDVNCAALPEKLAESILFGYTKGAFTGAARDQAGKFEQADGGTLFLDEIGELPLELQPKLLKILDDHKVERIGGRTSHTVDVRVVAASNRDLQREVATGGFREDLYHRLSYGLIQLPPLRERREDIRGIALAIVARLNRSLRMPKQLAPGALLKLEQQDWPGNVRALENAVGRSMLLCPRDTLEAEDLLLEPSAPGTDALPGLPTPAEGFSLEGFLEAARKQLILKALDASNGNQSQAARLLGLSPQAVHKFVKNQAD
jgi:DNA-binding NtrC family response regulator